MNNRENKSAGWKSGRIMPFVVEFIKFSAAFSLLVAFALVTLHMALAAQL